MSDKQSINFTKEAFTHPINLGVLLVSAVTALLLTDVGLAPHVLLSIIFGFELMYLGIVPRLPRFRKNFKMRKIREQSPAAAERSRFQGLDKKSQKRFLILKRLAKLIKENFDTMPYSSQGLLENLRNKVQELISNYLTLLDRHKRYQLYMDTSVEEGLKREVQAEKEYIRQLESDRLRHTKARRVKILQKRLKKFEIAKEKYLICETHLETIEDAVRYIYEESMTMSNSEEIGFKLDRLLEEVEETSQLINDLNKDILPFNSDLDDLDLDSDFLEMDTEEAELESKVNTSNHIKE